jgi:hypothetical protein
LEPISEFFSGKKKPLYTDEGISVVLQRGCEVIEMRSQWTPPQPSNDARSHKGVVEHMVVLFL